MKRSLWVLVLMCAVSGWLCAGSKVPEWINGSSAKYPGDRFVIGVGLGDTLDNARSAARAEISKVFRSSISQTARNTQSENTAVTDGKSGSSTNVSTDLATRVSTDGLLEGSEIVETWRDPKGGNYFALAVLNKLKLRQALAQQVTETEETANAQLAAAKTGATVFDRIHALTMVLQALDQRDELLARKRVVDPAGAGDALFAISRTDIVAQRRSLTDSIVFAVNAGEQDRDVANMVSAKISGMGLHIVDALSPTPQPGVIQVFIKPSLTIAAADRNNPQWKFYNWNAAFEMREGAADGRIIASAVRDGQSAHLTDETARSKARADGGQALALCVEQEISHSILGGK